MALYKSVYYYDDDDYDYYCYYYYAFLSFRNAKT